ncbi:dTDP-4-dehydrorhamnose reductase [Thermoplasma volcanium GSS1]|uniref:dTDP-4-dehydrorhamnose reductase n=1 Tax=Thermoplasma volcanium (strain ATCC 51530 / DSM 4299 / JCM 9571 / NBRC 15438 / GSS1) TaxID=273116 RepID=Q97A90_THEVO|nr:NAD(P)-dependent oxidoreductase [Thermoplasma volcanium]BAB60062.1 dTDP-4-dehydrorhamnose reductase [Thermoplasma volcanium GSS1]
MPNILIFGHTGQLGRELLKLVPNAISGSINGKRVDITDYSEIALLFSQASPDIVINSAAFTNVDRCEKEREKAYLVNAIGVRNIVKLCDKYNSKLIQISTDYVFNGERGNYKEDDIPDPINYYGYTKSIGDAYALSSDNTIVVRTSGVFGNANNFPLFVYNRLKAGLEVDVIKGYYSPIHANLLSKALYVLISKGTHRGIINIAGQRISRFDLATAIANRFGFDQKLIREVPDLKEMVARRPFDSSLDISYAKKLIDFDFYTLESNLNSFERSLKKDGEE